MRNIVYYISAAAVAGVIAAGFAEAQNHASIQGQNIGKKADIMHTTEHAKEFNEYLQKKQKHIEERYEKAIKYVNNTNLSAEQKKLLLKQAEESKVLAVRQLSERADLVKAHMAEKKTIMAGADTERDVRKAMKKIKEILKK